MKYFVTFVLVIVSTSAFAQITITESQYLNTFSQSAVYKTTYTADSAAKFATFVADSGANRTWDMSAMAFTKTTQTDVIDTLVPYPGGGVYADSFPTATHVRITKTQAGVTTYGYEIFSPTGYWMLGNAFDSANGNKSMGSRWNPPLQTVEFPLTSTTAWSGDTAMLVTDAHDTVLEQVREEVDSWGSVTLPGQPPIQTLRLHLYLTAVPILKGVRQAKYTTHEYIWGSETYPSIEVVAQGNAAPSSVNYAIFTPPSAVAVQGSNPFSLRVGSNPLTAPTSLFYTTPSAASARVSIIDMLGRNPQVLFEGFTHSGLNTLQLDPSKLSSGTYLLNIESGGNTATEKVVVEH